MNSKVGFVGAVILFGSVVGCAPNLKPFLLAPDNAKTQGITDVGPGQHGGKLTINAMSPENVAKFTAAGDPAICTAAGGKATPGAAFGDIQGKVAAWTKARANVNPNSNESVSAQGSSTKNSAQGSAELKNNSVIVTGPLDGDPLNVLKSLAIDCSADKGVITVNGEARPVDVIYAETRTTGAEVNFTNAATINSTTFLGWNSATNELTIVRARTGFSSEAQKDADGYKKWNAIVYRNLQGYVPQNTLPLAVRPAADGSVDRLEIVFPMTGMAITADAMVIHGPFEASAAAQQAPAEWIELDPIIKRK